jgi:uncharacterized protein YndB with AHSA1/START domain
MEQSNVITIEAVINASPAQVWEYWTSPKHIVNWNFAHESWCAPAAAIDLTVGGKFNYRMEACDGSAGFDFEGIFDEVIENQKLAYTLLDDRKVEIIFSVMGNQTKIMESFEAENVNPIDMQRFGWQSILDNFKNYTERSLNS